MRFAEMLHAVGLLSPRARRLRRGTIAGTLAGLLCFPAVCRPSANSTRVDVALQGTVAETISLVLATPTVAFGVLAPGIANSAPVGQTIAITSTWTLSAGETIKLYAYFDSATSALTGTLLGDAVPTSALHASFDGGAAQSFTQTSPFTAGSTAMQLYSIGITSANALTIAKADSLAMSLNLAGLNLHADTYVGTMHLQAQAM